MPAFNVNKLEQFQAIMEAARSGAWAHSRKPKGDTRSVLMFCCYRADGLGSMVASPHQQLAHNRQGDDFGLFAFNAGQANGADHARQ